MFREIAKLFVICAVFAVSACSDSVFHSVGNSGAPRTRVVYKYTLDNPAHFLRPNLTATLLASKAGSPLSPMASLGVQYSVRQFLIEKGMSPARANMVLETQGPANMCNNAAILAGGTVWFGVSFGLLCAVIWGHELRADYIAKTQGRVQIFGRDLRPQ